jgi:hypothetical protein
MTDDTPEILLALALDELGDRIVAARGAERERLQREAAALAERLGRKLVPVTREERERGAA